MFVRSCSSLPFVIAGITRSRCARNARRNLQCQAAISIPEFRIRFGVHNNCMTYRYRFPARCLILTSISNHRFKSSAGYVQKELIRRERFPLLFLTFYILPCPVFYISILRVSVLVSCLSHPFASSRRIRPFPSVGNKFLVIVFFF